jgi:hypothetical protein
MVKLLSFIVLTVVLLSGCASSKTPVGKGQVRVNTPYLFTNSTANTWSKIGQQITSTDYKEYYIEWFGFGGSMYIGGPFVKQMIVAKAQGKSLIFHINGQAASMHALAACYATTINFTPGTQLMFHSVGNKDVRNVSARGEFGWVFNGCVDKGILTQADVDKIWSGYILYVRPDGSNKTWLVDTRRPV